LLDYIKFISLKGIVLITKGLKVTNGIGPYSKKGKVMVGEIQLEVFPIKNGWTLNLFKFIFILNWYLI